jgi:ABC-type lipoprotein release transport system permease subunit
VGLGALGAWWLSAVVQSYLYGIEARDTTSFAAATIVMTLAAAIATVVPARRAAAVQPATALRAE